MTLPSYLFCDTCGAANRLQAAFCKVCGQSLHTSITNGTTSSHTQTGLLSPRHLLNKRYIVLSQLGRGGFGAVYKAADIQFGYRLVAIKEMSQSNMNAQEMQETTLSFKREALMLAHLTHPHLPRIYEQFEDNGRSYLVMDFIDGKTLEHLLVDLGTLRFPIEKTLAIGIQLCEVLGYLHSRQPQIIFRDLKPANIMLTDANHLYLIDFGIARHFKPGQSKDTAALGSTGYAAPEQYGKSQTTVRSDIYSLGATLHQLFTGNDPTDTPFTFSPLALQHLSTLTGLDALIAAMVSMDATKRPQSVLDVRQELQRLTRQLQMGTVHTGPATLPSAYQLPTSLAKIPVKTVKSAMPQISPMSNMLFACYGHSSRITALAWSPNGKYLASASYDKTVQLWDATNGQQLLTYKEHRERVNALAWSPDSKHLASASDDGTVRVWNALTGKTQITYKEHNGSVNAVAWSPIITSPTAPSTSYISSGGSDKVVHVWDSTHGKNLCIFRNHGHTIHAIAWAPDGKRIASADESGLVYAWYPVKEQPKKSFFNTFTSWLLVPHDLLYLSGHTERVNGLAWSPDSRYIASASSDHCILVRDAATGRTVYSFGQNRKGMKNCVSWSPNGKHIAFGGNDKLVELWSVAAKNASFTYHGHINYVTTVAWAPDSTRVASAGIDRTIQVWQAV